jgi:hypothetical protein
MKKIYLPILLAASMSFALTVDGNSSDQVNIDGNVFAPSFRISTQNSQGVNGFKVYVYFSNDEADDAPIFIKETLGYAGNAKKIELQKVTSHVYRVLIDFSNTNIPANSYYPPSRTVFFEALLSGADKYNRALRPYPWGKNFHNVVVTSKNGNVLSGKHPNFNSRVGVLSYNASVCKSGGFSYNGTFFFPDVVISLNSEKSNCKSSIEGPQPNGVVVSGRQVYFSYCAVEVSELPRTSYDYVVLRLDDLCPPGALPFRRRHDTEDSYGDNYVYGPSWPSSVGSNAELEYCFVPKDPTSTRKYPFDGTHVNDFRKTSVFAKANLPNLVGSTVHIDDEDSDNGDSWDYYGLSKKKADDKAIINRIHKIMDGSDNTTINVVTWKQSYTSKSANVADVHGSVNSAYVAAAPLAPAVKGLNRNVVAVELKSAGDVKVSIVGVNGAVIANVSEKNLQAGVHQIKWNAGMAPSGRYVVKVEQNGMVNAKSVILK